MKGKTEGIYFEQTSSVVASGIEESLILIREILTIGIKVMGKLEFKEQKNNEKDIRTAIIIGLFKEILERIDGILILLEKHSTLNANIILRSFMEISFDIRMILNNKGKKIVYYYIISKEIEYLKKQEKLKEEIENNPNIQNIEVDWDSLFKLIEEEEGLKKLRNKNTDELELEKLEELKNENIQELKKKFWSNKWFKLAGARNKYKTPIDAILYGELCKEIHGENILRDNYYKSGNIYEMRPLRFPIDYQNIIRIISYNFGETLKLLRNEFDFDKSYIESAEENYERATKIFNDKEKHLKRE